MNREMPSETGFHQLDDISLPIFSRESENLTLFYAPGYLAAARQPEADEIKGILAGELPFGNPTLHHLIRAAVSAREIWWRTHDPEHYQPVCLTIYSSLVCNLNCIYCFAERKRDPVAFLSKDLIMAAAGDVLANCREKKLPFTAVFHGGGEPSLDPRLPEILADLKALCTAEKVRFSSYIATNGVMDPDKARWIAENIEDIGLSTDGPPDIQDSQRPLRNGGISSPVVERTAKIFRQVQGKLTVRVTVLPKNFERIPEIAGYCLNTLEADEIRIEPVYYQGTETTAADEFCSGFLRAKQEFQAKCRISYSGSRIHEIHGRYCHIFRQVTQLVPPAGCSACFALSSQAEAEDKKLDPLTDDDIFERLSREDPACEHCFNRFHCSRGCPDVCPGTGEIQDSGSFRCRVNRKLAESELMDTARRLLFEHARKYGYAGMQIRQV